MIVRYKLLSDTATAPQKMTAHSSGWDLAADLGEPLELLPGSRFAVPTGIALEIPPGFEGQVRPRSGLALKFGLGVLNSPGTIDADYRGEVKVILINHSAEAVSIQPGTRIAQLVVCPVAVCELAFSADLEASVRADGGFGHTGH